MDNLAFTGAMGALLTSAKRGQLKRVTSDFAYYGSATVTLWMTTGEGFRVSSVMHNLDGRIEVGVLHVEAVLQAAAEESSVGVPWAFKNGCTAEKLVVEEAGRRAESGIALRSVGEGDELVIVAAAFPFRLYVKGIEAPAQEVAPEYRMARYIREAV